MEYCKTSRSTSAGKAPEPSARVARWLRRRFAAILWPALVLWWQPLTLEAATLNFRDVDIRQIIESVSELTGRNFLIDQRVKGKVTIVAASEVPDDAVYDVLLTVLAMHGFRTVDAGNGLTRVVPANAAARFSPLDLPEDLTTEIIKINHLNAAGIVPMVRPLMTGEAQVTVHKETNSIIVTELQANLSRIKDIIEVLDRKALGEYEIIELKRSKAQDLVNLVQRARSQQTRHLVEVIADVRTNRVILVGAPELRLPLRAMIAELDTLPDTEDAGRGVVRVLHLNYADAEEMKEILKGLLTKQFLDLAQEGADVSDSDDQKEDVKKEEEDDDDDDDDDDDSTDDDDTDDDKRYTVQADPATQRADHQRPVEHRAGDRKRRQGNSTCRRPASIHRGDHCGDKVSEDGTYTNAVDRWKRTARHSLAVQELLPWKVFSPRLILQRQTLRLGLFSVAR